MVGQHHQRLYYETPCWGATLFGAAYTYASSEAGRESAPGQLTVPELRQIYGIMEI